MTSPSVDAHLTIAPALPFFRSQVGARLLAVAVAAIAAIVLIAVFVRTTDSERGDFGVYYSAARAIREGAPLYDRALAWRDAGYAVYSPAPDPVGVAPYVYPPLLAMALIPLSFLPLRDASFVWTTLTMACLIGTAYILVGLLFPRVSRWVKLPAVLGLGAVITLFQPARSTLYFGQGDAVLLLLMALALAAFVRARDGRTALWLALAMAIKPMVGFLILYLLWKRAYRAASLAAGLAAALVLLPFAVLGAGAAVDAFVVAAYWSSPSFGVSPINQSPYGLLLRMFTPNAFTVPIVDAPLLAIVLRVLVIVVTLGLLAAIIRRSRTVPPGHLALEYGLAIVGMLLASPLSENFHYVYLAIPFVATAGVLLARPSMPGRLPLAALLALVLGYLSLPGLNNLSHAFYAHYMSPVTWPQSLLTGVHLYGLCALAALMFVVARRDASHEPTGRR